MLNNCMVYCTVDLTGFHFKYTGNYIQYFVNPLT